MRIELTLSLPAKTVLEAKQLARLRQTTVSALFAESLKLWRTTADTEESDSQLPHAGLDGLVGAFRSQAPFDDRSAHIRGKHG